MSCPDCNGDLAAFTVPEPFESYTPEVALIVGLRANCLRLRPTEAPSNDGALRSLAGAPPGGDMGAAVTLFVGMPDSPVLDRAGTADCAEFVERPGIDMYLVLDRLQQTATAPHFDVARRQRQLDVFL